MERRSGFERITNEKSAGEKCFQIGRAREVWRETMLDVRLEDEAFALPYAHLNFIKCNGDSAVTLSFTSHLVKIQGQRLRPTRMRVISEAHGLSADGLRYFGLMEVANCQQTQDYAYVLGLRNSHDKRFPAGLAVGASVFVCDNLSFSGEIKIARKHTRHIVRDLPERWHQQARRIDAYRSHKLGDKRLTT